MQALQSFRELTLDLLQSNSNKQLQQVQRQFLEQHHQKSHSEEQQQQQQTPIQQGDQQEILLPTMGMAKRYFVETVPGSRPQVVSLKRSRSYGGHQNRVRELDYIKVSLDEWNSLVEKERKLQHVNRSVVDESNALKAILLNAEAENKRLNESLRRARGPSPAGDAPAPAPALPSAMKKTYREEEKLRAKIEKLEEKGIEIRNENLNLQERNRSLQRQVDEAMVQKGGGVAELVTDVEYWKNLSRLWRSRYLGLRRRYDELYDLLDTRSKKLRAYEDILERNGMV